MPRRTMTVCSVPGCPELTTGGRCDEHKRQAERRRGGYAQRGGGNQPRWRRIRNRVLERDPLCTCTDEAHGHGPRCLDPATVADHYPTSKRELVAQGVPDPDAMRRLRGLCASCHGKHTAATSPGGWNAQ